MDTVDYTCREPECGEIFHRGTTAANRDARKGHENRAHADSPHRVWRCPRDCGPGGNHYELDSLRGHMSRGHRMDAAQMDAAMPGIQERRTALLEAIDDEVKDQGAAVDTAPRSLTLVSPAGDHKFSPEDVLKAIAQMGEENRILADSLSTAEHDLEGAQTRLAEYTKENAGLTAEVNRRGQILAQIGALIQGVEDAGGSGG